MRSKGCHGYLQSIIFFSEYRARVKLLELDHHFRIELKCGILHLERTICMERIYSISFSGVQIIDVLFHQRVRVFDQGLKTRESNKSIGAHVLAVVETIPRCSNFTCGPRQGLSKKDVQFTRK